MKARLWLLGLVAVALGSGPAARADEPAKPAGPFVVIVGAGEFQDPAIKPRPTADADAKALFDVLTDSKYLAVPADRVKLLLSKPDEARKAQVATRDNIVKAVEAATTATHKDDLIILAFFGRGASAGDKTVFLTPDTKFKERAKTGLVYGTDLKPAFEKVKSQDLLVLMDVHYKGWDAGSEKVAEPTLQDVITLVFGSEEKEESVRAQDRLMILSGFISSDPLAKGDHGLFASTLIDALKGAADKPPYNQGYEPDGVVTTDELIKYLEKVIPDQARVIGKTDKEKEAQPVFIGAATSHFVVTTNPAETAKVKKRLDALAALAKAGTVGAEEAKEGAALLARMPKLKAFQELRKDYQKLADGTLGAADFTTARTAIKEGLKLPPRDADAYARQVIEASDIVLDLYIKALNPGDLIAAAIKGMYRRIEVPMPADLEDALKKPKELTEARRGELLREARMRLGKREDLEDNKDVDLSVLMMMASLNDPYSVYYDKEAVRRTASQLRGRFPGVGILIRRDAVHDALLVVSPIKDSPALRGGIKAGDLIVEIRREVDSFGKPLPPDAQRTFTTKGMKTEDAIKIITGTPGTPITLVIQREGVKDPIVVDLKRQFVMVESVLGVKRDAKADWNFYVDPTNKIGYVRITQFIQAPDGKGTFADLKKAIDELEASGLKGLVLDLRGDPGGYLISATKICELFVGKEKLVSVKPRPGSGAGRPRVYTGERDGETKFPMAVLVNGNSASASEIVSACLQDHGRAVIIGEKTYGKGSVQDVVGFPSTGGEIKLTIARYYPPSDRNIDKLAAEQDPSIKQWGVSPDKGFEVKLTREEQTDLAEHLHDLEVIGGKKDAKPFKDKQLDKALEYLREQTRATGAGARK